jgi:hypothetical protein
VCGRRNAPRNVRGNSHTASVSRVEQLVSRRASGHKGERPSVVDIAPEQRAGVFGPPQSRQQDAARSHTRRATNRIEIAIEVARELTTRRDDPDRLRIRDRSHRSEQRCAVGWNGINVRTGGGREIAEDAAGRFLRQLSARRSDLSAMFMFLIIIGAEARHDARVQINERVLYGGNRFTCDNIVIAQTRV